MAATPNYSDSGAINPTNRYYDQRHAAVVGLTYDNAAKTEIDATYNLGLRQISKGRAMMTLQVTTAAGTVVPATNSGTGVETTTALPAQWRPVVDSSSIISVGYDDNGTVGQWFALLVLHATGLMTIAVFDDAFAAPFRTITFAEDKVFFPHKIEIVYATE